MKMFVLKMYIYFTILFTYIQTELQKQINENDIEMNKLKNELSRISHESQNNKEKYDDDLKSYKEEIEKLKRIIEDKDVYIYNYNNYYYKQNENEDIHKKLDKALSSTTEQKNTINILEVKNGKLKFEVKESNDIINQLKMDLQQENNKYSKLQTQYNEILSRNNV